MVFEGKVFNEQSCSFQSQGLRTKFWAIYCRPGRERETTILLFHKARSSAITEKRPDIYSVSCRDELRALIYIEAPKLLHVKEIVRKVPTVLPNMSHNIKNVPAGDAWKIYPK